MNKSKRKMVYPLAALVSIGLSLQAFAVFTVTTNGTVVTLSNTDSDYTYDQPCLAADVSSVSIDAGKPILWYPASASTYTGGTVIQRGQLYLCRNDTLGTGPVALGENGSIIVDRYEVDLPNKVVFGQGANSYATSLTAGSLTLRSVGTEEDASTHHIRLGRIGASDPSHVTLGLTDPGSEAIDSIYLSGMLSLLLDGGTVKARATCENPFFRVMTASPMDVTVSKNGVTFETQAGTELFTGGKLNFPRSATMNLVETYYPSNWSFEEGGDSAYTGGWHDDPHPNKYNENCGIYSNGTAFDTSGTTAWPTTNGTRYAMIRRAASIYQDVEIPSDGLWRIVFEQGCRPADSYSMNMSMTVTMSNVVAETCDTWITVPAITAKEAKHGFVEFRSGLFEIGAGSYRLRFSVSDVGYGSASMNVDAVRFERIEVLPPSAGTLAKTGEGRMSLAPQSLNGVTVDVTGGEMRICDCDIAGATVNVASGATAALFNPSAGRDSSVNVASGGVLVIGEAPGNLVTNGNFDANGAVCKSVAPFGWTCRRLDDRDKSSSGFGMQTNDSIYSVDGPATPYGDTTIFLRVSNSVSQVFSVDQAGTYVISFAQACRRYLSSHTLQTTLAIDGAEVLVTPVRQEYYGFTRFSASVTLSAGTHEISFTTGDTDGNGSGEIVFIDDVSVRLDEARIVYEGTINMEPGSVLRLNNSCSLFVDDLRVGGTPVRGRRNAVSAAGVIVEGTGGIRIGKPLGLVIHIR